MKKRIVICADGTWNRPERNVKKDMPTNVLRLARAIKPLADDNKPQQVFYDWGIGSYHDNMVGGITGKGLHKNIMDDYRYIVQNYSPGDELYLFGFSRGAYTIRCLCGMINNCGLLKRDDANLIEEAFKLYKRKGSANKPNGKNALDFRDRHCHKDANGEHLRQVKFVGVWDTVGAMGIPISFLGLFEEKDEFYDTKIGNNVETARHALAIDEHRADFHPTIWQKREQVDIKQVWFAGSHADIGGGYDPDSNGSLASSYPLQWMLKEAAQSGLSYEDHVLSGVNFDAGTKLNDSRVKFYLLREKLFRPIDHKQGQIIVHQSVKERWQRDEHYRPKNLVDYLKEHGVWPEVAV